MAAGCRIDPPVSEPSARGVSPAATATADPPLDPPGIPSSAQGLHDGPNAEFSVDEPMANSSQLVLPTITAPARVRRETTVASYGGTNASRIFDEAVVRTPFVQMLSLSATGTPASGASRNCSRSRSITAARAIASSAMKGLNTGSEPAGAATPSH